MQHQVCTRYPGLATLAPFLAHPGPDPTAITAPSVCACGQPLDMELERDLGECVDCQAEAAGATNRRSA